LLKYEGGISSARDGGSRTGELQGKNRQSPEASKCWRSVLQNKGGPLSIGRSKGFMQIWWEQRVSLLKGERGKEENTISPKVTRSAQQQGGGRRIKGGASRIWGGHHVFASGELGSGENSVKGQKRKGRAPENLVLEFCEKKEGKQKKRYSGGR